MIGANSYLLLYLEGANVLCHELRGANPLEGDVGNAKKHIIILLELQRALALVCVGMMTLLSSLKEPLGSSQAILQSSCESRSCWVLHLGDA